MRFADGVGAAAVVVTVADARAVTQVAFAGATRRVEVTVKVVRFAGRGVLSATGRAEATDTAALGVRRAVVDAAAGAHGHVRIAGAANGRAARRVVAAQASAQVAMARAAIDVAAASRATVAETGAGGFFAAHQVDAPAALVVTGDGVAERATRQA